MPAIFARMDKLKPVYDIVDKCVMTLCKLLLIADILITCMAVTGRYVPFIPDPAWSEEIVLTLMAYMTVLSAAIALRHGTHIRMTALDKYLPKALLRWLELLADVAVVAFAIVMLTSGFEVCSKMARASYTSIPSLSKFWQYFPVPLAGITMLIFELEVLYNHIKAFFIKDEKPDEKTDEKEAIQA